ncbi:Disease resistance protein [Melia azedarach]|uniref:Disease resistance protein n=1 Tax=Melia azedarach TaxID=155640 RepID=A0ACC1YEQ4_MELAZ|nr:Disease resistance protein [Melia azedarach]
MKDIFAIEKEDESNNIETIENIKLNQLRSLTLKSLPQLKSFCSKLKIPCTSKKGGDEVMFEDDITVSCTLFTKEAALPNLDYLELREINVRTIWQNHVAAIASGIKNLTRLILHGCNNLRYLFSSSIASNFAQLQHLHISECQALEVVVATEEGGCIELPSLKQLEIRKCPKLKEFMVENTSTDNLKKVPLVGYDKKERHHPPCHPPPADFSPQSVKNGAEFNGSNYSTQKPSSEYLGYKSFIDEGLKLENMTVDESIKIHSPSFKEEELKVKNMTVDDSIKLQSPFLKEGEFKIKEMSTNKLTEVPSPSFNRKGLKLKNMTVDESTKIHSPSFKEEEFKIKEMSANKLTEVPSSSFNKKEFMGKSTSAHQVEKNSLSSFKKKEFAAKNISPDELTKITLSFFNKKVVLPNLENLIIEECNNLQCLFSSSTVKSFLGLQCLEIFRCPVLEVIFDLEGANSENKYTGIVSQLRELKIHALPKLKHVWNKDPQKLVSFEQLKRVSIIECDGLRNVFPMSIAKSLSKLRTLDISKCGVEEIVYVGGQGAKTNTTFVFPRVISLQLYDLPNFKMFCPGIYTAEWPELKELRMSGWETVMKILESNEGLAHTLLEKVLPNLKKLSVQAKDIAMIRQYPEHLIDFICKIKYLEVDLDNATAIVSLDLLLQRLDSMKMLQICGTNIDPYGEVLDENGGMSAVIKNLNKCSDLDHILKEECNMNHLVHLRVYMCLKLINLVPSFTSFRNLTTLQLSYCHRLTNIVPSSTAKSLVQLRKMSIESCDRLTEVVAADEEDAAKDCEIVCNQLKELHLFRLASLSSFCSANYTLKFPSLEELHAGKCPKMKSFSGGELSTPKLQEITYQGTTVKLRKGDLNTTIQELHEEERLLQHSKEDSAGPPSTQPPE